MRTKLVIALGCLLLFPLMNEAQRRVYVRPFYRPYVYRHYYDPFWDPWFYGPNRFSTFNNAYTNKGEVKLQDFDKHDDVFVNGSFAGNIGQAKDLWLDPGSYNIVVKSQGEPIVDRQVYVATGKTVKIKAGLG